MPAAAQQAGRFPKTLDVKNSGAAAGRVHFNPAILGKYSLTAQDIAASAGSILSFHAKVWEFAGPVFWDLYVVDQYADKSASLGNTSVSATRKVAGATKPGPMACVTLLGLDNLNSSWRLLSSNDARFSTRVDFVMAHEATHCFQRITSKSQNESVAYQPADWFMEGSASWLAGDYLESTGRDYPGYFEILFREHHQKSMLILGNTNHFFFKWLEGKQALKSRAAVMRLVRDMLDAPWSDCMTRLPVEIFVDERKYGNNKIKDCAKTASPYEKLLKQWFANRKSNIADILSIFGSAIVRGTVPGIRAPHLFLKKVTMAISPGFNTARMSVLATGVPVPTPLGKIAPFSKPAGKKQGLPEAFGFVVFEVRLSEPLVPPPSGYHITMEGVDDDISGQLSSEKSDDVLHQKRGWILTKFLEGNWLSIARSDPAKGQNTRLLFRAAP